MTLFDYAQFAVGLLIVISAVKPTVTKARISIYQARQGVQEVLRRKHSLSQQIRTLARESLHQRTTSVSDRSNSENLHDVIEGLTRKAAELECVDRRVLILDERRGLQESGWIICLHRSPDNAPALEPPRVTETWAEGRYLFFWAQDENKARRKANIRFPEDQGFRVLEATRHEGDLSDMPALSSGTGAGKHDPINFDGAQVPPPNVRAPEVAAAAAP
jgi:hypothetical protein